MKQEIIIWEMSAQRIHAMQRNVEQAIKRLGIEAEVQINCEEPLISRHDLLGKLPSVQVNGDKNVWSCGYGKAISEEEFIALFQHLRELKLMNF